MENQSQNVWQQNGDKFFLRSAASQINTLPVGVYEADFHPMSGWSLQFLKPEFNFPYKIYGIEDQFISRVVKTWENTAGNLGVLLNGLRGTGKTVTAELIANRVKLPVIVISKQFDAPITDLLGQFTQDVVVLIDEFEKLFDRTDGDLLTVMDGVFNSVNRKLWLLTTNDLHINPNMINRPGRIRYLKQFSDLKLDVIEELVDDLLIDKRYRRETVQFVSTLSIITIDIVKAIVQEVNLHGQVPEDFKDVLNVEQARTDCQLQVYDDERDLWVTVEFSTRLKPEVLNTAKFGAPELDLIFDSVYNGQSYLGELQEIIGDDVFKVSLRDSNKKIRLYKVIPNNSVHKSFMHYVF